MTKDWSLRNWVAGLDLSFWSYVVKSYSFAALFGEFEWKHVAPQISPAHRTIYFSQLLVTNLLSETLGSRLKQYINSNKVIKTAILIVDLKSKICSKLIIEAPDVDLYLNIYLTHFSTFFFFLLTWLVVSSTCSNHVNAERNALLP